MDQQQLPRFTCAEGRLGASPDPLEEGGRQQEVAVGALHAPAGQGQGQGQELCSGRLLPWRGPWLLHCLAAAASPCAAPRIRTLLSGGIWLLVSWHGVVPCSESSFSPGTADPPQRSAGRSGIAHRRARRCFLEPLPFPSIQRGCSRLSETCLERTQPTQRAAPQRQAVSKRAACVKAALSCETTAPCRAWDGTSGALTTFQMGSAASHPEIPMGDSIALYSPSELLRSPSDGQWKWLLGVTRTANDRSGPESCCACARRCAYMRVYFLKMHMY